MLWIDSTAAPIFALLLAEALIPLYEEEEQGLDAAAMTMLTCIVLSPAPEFALPLATMEYSTTDPPRREVPTRGARL